MIKVMDVRQSDSYSLITMKNILRIIMTLSLLVFASSAVLRAGDMVGDGSGTYRSISVAVNNSAPLHDAQMRDAIRCDDCTDMTAAIASCHFLCTIVVMPDLAGFENMAMPAGFRMVLPAIDRATGLSHVPDPLPPRYFS
ncbi:hypothetical protein AUP45_12980 [Thalassospira xiamenensis]|nr:hypothetical protein AUP45_12980 [Thalassospira xiamenensis]